MFQNISDDNDSSEDDRKREGRGGGRRGEKKESERMMKTGYMLYFPCSEMCDSHVALGQSLLPGRR